MSENKENIVWFGMKVTLQEKKRIQKLAKMQGYNQKTAVMQAVEDKLATYDVKYTGTSIYSDIESYLGVIDGEPDLSTNKDYLSDFGKKNTRER